MPLGWECRNKFIKQVPTDPTQPRASRETHYPGPANYVQPQILGGTGFSKIKRSPAYTFGINIQVATAKSAVGPNALLLNIQGQTRRGRPKVPGGTAALRIEPNDRKSTPGPDVYKPVVEGKYRRPPAYTMRVAAKPEYQAWDQWTPSPNMYWPPIPGRRQPTYSFQAPAKNHPVVPTPSAGEYNANYSYCQRKAPAYSLGPRQRPEASQTTPAPNAYCNKLFMANKRTIPAPTFGIKHSPYAGEQKAYLKSQDLQVATF